MTGTLFLGGPRHGERHPIPRHMRAVQVQVPITQPTIRRDLPASWSRFETVTYIGRRIGFYRVPRAVTVYALATWSDAELDEAIAKWIETGE